MAGSYNHCVKDDGTLRAPKDLARSLDNGGDVWEAVEELYGMIWLLAQGRADLVEAACLKYKDGIDIFAPGQMGYRP